ncbi:MAG: energy transducer TonB, partial [Acidobacteria bacterium]|nr:energy transducer TonB [Acidobacteriota bacterium]
PGSRAVVGAMDGPSAPYIFVILRPLSPQEAKIISNMPKTSNVHEAGITKPKLIKRVPPVYPESARKDKVSGIVVLQTIIGADGTVQSVTPLKSADARLTKAAERAVLQWKFSPARDRTGRAIPVFYVLTARFLLQ